MASTTASYPIEQRQRNTDVIKLPAKAAIRIDEGHLIMMIAATGYVEPAVGATAGAKCPGWCKKLCDNSAGAAADLYAEASCADAAYAMKAGDAFTNADIGATAYVSTSAEVMKTAGSNPITAGIFMGLTESGRALIRFTLG